ncbi:UDP-N-acetylmuramate dehydrogenase [Thiogranum longum]|uniref:UDP-N-acetylenolpyruvoylglucosamine reductase n=2 Tax=Thiogranum longum TaxID=1537524 RepID=A0A4R1H7Y0_9GAMM|nr:UDP-N-acetylmuramate dehydrogenase [Thiogranum longum]TCK17318.1 UDP-N-acetylmuramate dehydrogenase [Thiogranum longum]
MMTAESMPVLRGELKFNEPLSAYTSWRVGGPADRCYRPADLEDLQTFLASLPEDEPLEWIGLGSNILVRDGGLRGTVILPFGGLDSLEQLDDNIVRTGAGVACNKVARFAARAGLTGAEFLAGIPGTMGGALAMNAGAFGGETWPLVARVEMLDHHGELHLRDRSDFDVSYRTVTGLRDEWFVSAELQLEPGDAQAALENIKALLEQRSATQPTGLPSCGSVFRNPPNDFAARLIDTCGLKGERIGNAQVSEKHANFIINLGEAKAEDIEALIRYVQERVAQVHGVRLEPEVRIIGVFA